MYVFVFDRKRYRSRTIDGFLHLLVDLRKVIYFPGDV